MNFSPYSLAPVAAERGTPGASWCRRKAGIFLARASGAPFQNEQGGGVGL